MSWDVDAIYHPLIRDERTDDEVIDCIVQFATTYKSKGKGWEWPHEEENPASSNCREFIKEMRAECKLERASIPVKRPK